MFLLFILLFSSNFQACLNLYFFLFQLYSAWGLPPPVLKKKLEEHLASLIPCIARKQATTCLLGWWAGCC
jgi:hypothetical protein